MAPGPSPMNRRRALVAAVFGVVWLTAAPAAPPLYDGLGFPDEPYRYLSPPPGAKKTPAPSTAAADFPVTPGVGNYVELASTEVGPQVQIDFNQADLTPPPA